MNTVTPVGPAWVGESIRESWYLPSSMFAFSLLIGYVQLLPDHCLRHPIAMPLRAHSITVNISYFLNSMFSF